MNGDIFIDDTFEDKTVQKWEANTNSFITVMYVESPCSALFVDNNYTLYCSMSAINKVVKRWLNDSNLTSITTVVGTDSRGLASNELSNPHGIFVDTNFDLYVADSTNHRVKLFPPGKLNGIVVVGRNSSNPTIDLNYPIGIVLDAEKNLFVVEYWNHRIIGSSSNVFRCLVGCDGQGSESNRLSQPGSLSFDRFGNLFVADQLNHRIQKFEYLEKSCGKLK